MFQGFDPAVIDFLWELRFHNSREWFEPRKADYKTLLETPMKELCREAYVGFSARHRELALMSKVSRIYRDARRLFGRGPYKDHLWFIISEPGDRWSARPAFWFELGPENYSYGMGYWMAGAREMAKLRRRMDRDPKTMEELVRPFEGQDAFVLEGEDFKRRKIAPSELLDPWYNKRGGMSMGCYRNHDELLWSADLPGVLLEEWEKLVPLYRYLVTLAGEGE